VKWEGQNSPLPRPLPPLTRGEGCTRGTGRPGFPHSTRAGLDRFVLDVGSASDSEWPVQNICSPWSRAQGAGVTPRRQVMTRRCRGRIGHVLRLRTTEPVTKSRAWTPQRSTYSSESVGRAAGGLASKYSIVAWVTPPRRKTKWASRYQAGAARATSAGTSVAHVKSSLARHAERRRSSRAYRSGDGQ
jgi:hypothetical protein